jgi:hypothetical protein
MRGRELARGRARARQRWIALAAALAGGGGGGCSSSTAGGGSPADGGPDATLDAGTDGAGGDGGGDASEDVVPRLARTLGLDVNAAADGQFLTAYGIARDAGVQAVNVSVVWKTMETVPDAGPDGGGDAGGPSDFEPNLHIANLVFGGTTKVSLALLAVDPTGPELPSDLTGRPLDAPEVSARYNAAQDYVFGEIPDLSLAMYVVGSEIDLAFATDAAKWSAYKTFFDAAAAYARTLRPGVKVGTVVTLAGAKAHPELVAPILQNADFLGLTYAPLQVDFTVRPVEGVRADVDAIVALYPTTPLFFRQAGYPSSTDVGSSPDQQAAFVTELFRAWDAHQAQIPLMTFFTMNDYSPQAVTQLAQYYGSSDPKFLAYLGSVGLRTYAPASGTNKPGWDALVRAAAARGW